MLSILTPDSGLIFETVLSAWPFARGINATHNGQRVGLADNCVVRIAEGGTGMSKMGSNAQTLLDMIGCPELLPGELRIPYEFYSHTLIDQRKKLTSAMA
jgi:hypothetical protein